MWIRWFSDIYLRLAQKTEFGQDINEFLDQKAEMQMTPVDPDCEIWASEFTKFGTPVNPVTVPINQPCKAYLNGKAGEATVASSKPPVKLEILNDPIYGCIATTFSSTGIPSSNTRKERIPKGRTNRSSAIQSCETLPGRELETLPG
jgi:hypothetical protein